MEESLSAVSLPVSPNLSDYESFRQSFTWAREGKYISGLPDNKGLNIAYEAVDKHAGGKLKNTTALRWIRKDRTIKDYSYDDMSRQSSRFANMLVKLGIQKGERVFTLLGRVPELYIASLGTLKTTAVFCPLFSVFGPEPVFQRLSKGEAKVLVTTTAMFEKKVRELLERLPSIQFIMLTDADQHTDQKILSLPKLLNEAPDEFTIPPTQPEDPALLHFTSGTTGMPKGALHVHNAVYMHYVTGKYVLDFHEGDIFWCTADPGWVTGTSYGIIAPFVNGITNIVDEEEFDAARWYSILEEHKVNVWYTAPTAIHRLMRMNIKAREQYHLGALRLICSVGEPLPAEAVKWGERTFGMPIMDNWWQTETGGIMIANFRAMPVKPGSMGKPLPGIEAAIAEITADGLQLISEPGRQGQLVLKKGWPSMFRNYLHEQERYNKCFSGEWYITGDLASIDSDGYFWFKGRADDIIKTSGHLVGPFEVESNLLQHEAVAEAAVIGKPDPVIGELVKAFIVLKPGIVANENTQMDIMAFARKKMGPAVAPKEIAFIDALPKTKSGKTLRRLLKARELGLPEGDLSTLEATVLSRDHGLDLLYKMMLTRRFEEAAAEMYTKTKIRGFLHLYIGEEAVATGVMVSLSAQDNVLCTYREHGQALVRGIDPNSIMAEMYGKQEGCSKGRGGSMHLFDAKTKFFGGNAIVASHLPVAVGMALADKKKQQKNITCCFFGDGAAAEGEFHEAMNLAALWSVPVLFVCENNLYAMGTAIRFSHAVTELEKKGPAYGIDTAVVDGMDVLAVEKAAQGAIAKIRASGKPFFLVCNTYRFRAHSMFDAELYREKNEVEEWKKQDPINKLQQTLLKDNTITQNDIDELSKKVEVKVREAVDFAEAGTWEPVDQLTNFVNSPAR
ncbi:acetate--CoA ligase [Flavihumibacter profundi]|uniref:acetate--CoA ligase n=1 Tax=Flavihumibacter profundi TaxID=2716883 RepID=UPI001CC5619C|nr:acetate--CoA ligase [Flavihumibacter profundi]MBZ5855585.1 acetate--CoA ligase [Flavihumibacter profundi]